MNRTTTKYLIILMTLWFNAVGVHAAEPWLAVNALGRTPPVEADDEVRSIAFVGLPIRVQVEIGVTDSPASAGTPECIDGLVIDELWYEDLAWSWSRLDGEAIEVPEGRPERQSTAVAPRIRIEPGTRDQVIFVFQTTPPVGRYRLSATARVSGCAGTDELIGTSDVFEVFRGDETGWVTRQYLMAKKERASSFEDYIAIMEEVAESDPDDTGAWMELALAYAERGDIESTLKYHQLFVDKTKQKMNKKYGTLTNWPAASQKSWSRVETRHRSLREVARDASLQIGVGPNRGFVVMSRENMRVLRTLDWTDWIACWSCSTSEALIHIWAPNAQQFATVRREGGAQCTNRHCWSERRPRTFCCVKSTFECDPVLPGKAAGGKPC